MLAIVMLMASLVSPREVSAGIGLGLSRSVYPNPFTDGTTFQLTMPTEGVVTIRVYDIAGRLMKTPEEGTPFAAGSHNIDWDGTDLGDHPVPPGVYVCALFSNNVFVNSVKVVKING